MQVSVIIPSYKPKEYLWECLDSLCKQTMNKQQFEILLILNGCCEPYKSQVEKYITDNMQELNIRFIQTNQPGVSNARNIGIDEAKGEYLAFIDDDDYVSPSYLQELYDIAITGITPVSNVIAFNDGENSFLDSYIITRLFKKMEGKKKVPIMQARTFMSVPIAKLLLAKGIVGSRRFDIRLKNGEDSLFMLEISDKIKYICPTNIDAIYYRRYREGSAMFRKRPLRERVNCKFRNLIGYSRCLMQPWRYNILFVMTRIAALLK